MPDTANLILPLMSAAQSQKHVTHNEAVLRLDALVQLAVKSTTLTAPPSSPADGDRYLIASGATGAWASKDLNITYYSSGAWVFLPPRKGWLCWDEVNGVLLTYKGAPTYWTQDVVNAASLATLLASGTPASRIGINTASDVNNRLAVKANSFFFSHDDVTPGTGDMRGSLNKSTSAKDVSLTFNTNWSARAILGLLADDDLRAKVSPDGSTYYEAWSLDRSSGLVRMPNGASIKGFNFDTRKAVALSQAALLGPDKVWLKSAAYLGWTGRFIAIATGKGSHFSTSGYFDINMPPVGTVITGYNGAADVTVTSDGIPISVWQILYYELPIGSGAPVVNANFKIAAYNGSGYVVPENWIVIAIFGSDTLECRLGCGSTIYTSDAAIPRNSTYRSAVNQCAFTAYGNTGSTITGPAQIVFTNKQVDKGSDYSTSTGKFTAPEAGLYSFSVTMLQVGTSTLQASFRKNSAGLASGRHMYSTPAPGTTYTQVAGHIILELAEGDTVDVYLDVGSIYGGADLLMFSGRRLSAAW